MVHHPFCSLQRVTPTNIKAGADTFCDTRRWTCFRVAWVMTSRAGAYLYGGSGNAIRAFRQQRNMWLDYRVSPRTCEYPTLANQDGEKRCFVTTFTRPADGNCGVEYCIQRNLAARRPIEHSHYNEACHKARWNAGLLIVCGHGTLLVLCLVEIRLLRPLHVL